MVGTKFAKMVVVGTASSGWSVTAGSRDGANEIALIASALRPSVRLSNGTGSSPSPTLPRDRLRLRAETGDGDVRRLSGSASLLHENFYENELLVRDVADGPDNVEALLA